MCPLLIASRSGLPLESDPRLVLRPGATDVWAQSTTLAAPGSSAKTDRLIVPSGQRRPAEGDALSEFGHAIGAGRHRIFEFNRGLDVPLVIADQLQDLFDRRVSFAERHVRTVVQLAVLHVDMCDAVVVLLDEW